MAAVPLFPGSQGLLDTVFQTYPTRSRRLRAFDAKSRLGVSPLILQPARDFQRRKFVLNTLPAVVSLCFFHGSLSRLNFPSPARRARPSVSRVLRISKTSAGLARANCLARSGDTTAIYAAGRQSGS